MQHCNKTREMNESCARDGGVNADIANIGLGSVTAHSVALSLAPWHFASVLAGAHPDLAATQIEL